LNYVETVRSQIAKVLPDEKYEDLVDLYTLLALIFGSSVTEEDVHNAWSVWKNNNDPDHRSIVGFRLLPVQDQVRDTKYVEIIREAVAESYK
jgi:hypothetical protein